MVGHEARIVLLIFILVARKASSDVTGNREHDIAVRYSSR